MITNTYLMRYEKSPRLTKPLACDCSRKMHECHSLLAFRLALTLFVST